MKKFSILFVFLTFNFSEILLGDTSSSKFKFCEVVGIIYPSYSVNLICYEDSLTTKTWISCNNGEDSKCKVPEQAPIFNKCPETLVLSREISQLRNKIATQSAGRCVQQGAQGLNLMISNIKDISYIYMALKDNLVLTDVTTTNGELTESILTRQERKTDQFKKFGESIMMEIHEIGKPMMLPPSGPDLGGPHGVPPQGGGKMSPENMCINIMNKMQSEKDMLEAKNASFEAQKVSCLNGN